MKKILASMACLVAFYAPAQQIQDLVLFGQEQRTGTARFQAMAGAFGALGGDFSALAINPAGTAVFTHNQLGLNLSYYHTLQESQFNAQQSTAKKGHLAFNQAGIVFVYENKNNSPWKRISLGLNSDHTQQFKQNTNASGLTNQGLDQYFLDYANGTPFGDILKLDNELLEEAYLNIGAEIGYTAQQAFLGYYGGVIDPAALDNNSISSYVSNAKYSQLSQSIQSRTKGTNSKFIASTAAQYRDFLFLGAGIEFQSLSYEKQGNIIEDRYSSDSDLEYMFFDNFIQTTGEGVALSVGGIVKLGHTFRLGLSYKSPTWYTMLDKTNQQLETNLEDIDLSYIDRNIINVFEEYRMTIPSIVTASAAFVIGKRGLISADFSQQDFSKARFRPSADAYFSTLNQEATETLGMVNTLRIGGEYNLGRLSLRAGYSYNNSPYQSEASERTQKSLGLGWIFGASKIDFSLSQWQQSGDFRSIDHGTSPQITLNTSRHIASLGYTLFL